MHSLLPYYNPFSWIYKLSFDCFHLLLVTVVTVYSVTSNLCKEFGELFKIAKAAISHIAVLGFSRKSSVKTPCGGAM